MTNVFEDITGQIKQMMKNLKIEHMERTFEEIQKEDYEKEKELIEPHLDRKFGNIFKNVKNLKQFNFDDETREKIKEFVLKKDKTFLLLRGGTGTAKTCIAKIIYKHIIEKLLEKLKRFPYALNCVQYIRALDFFDELKNQFDDRQAITQFINYHSSLSLLIIDEVGATYGTENERIQFNRLIDNFYTAEKGKMILISNIIDNQELGKYISKPSFSRICEKGYIINFQGIDYRKTKKDEINQK